MASFPLASAAAEWLSLRGDDDDGAARGASSQQARQPARRPRSFYCQHNSRPAQQQQQPTRLASPDDDPAIQTFIHPSIQRLVTATTQRRRLADTSANRLAGWLAAAALAQALPAAARIYQPPSNLRRARSRAFSFSAVWLNGCVWAPRANRSRRAASGARRRRRRRKTRALPCSSLSAPPPTPTPGNITLRQQHRISRPTLQVTTTMTPIRAANADAGWHLIESAASGARARAKVAISSKRAARPKLHPPRI